MKKEDEKNSIIFKLRKELKLTQKVLGEKTNIDSRTIQKYENGEIAIRNMSLGNAEALSKVLNCKIEDLLQ